MSRLQAHFQSAAPTKKSLITFITAGDPHPDLTVPLLHEMVAAGADVLELGIPFTDPMAEGPVIQAASERALAHGVTVDTVLAMVHEFRHRDSQTPIILMGYTNPVENYGYVRFADALKEAGADGVIIVDCPPEESASLQHALQPHGLDFIYLVAPTTPLKRQQAIIAQASGFIYYVSLKGVTGAANLQLEDITQHVETLKTLSDLPVAVGFGIRTPEQAAAIAAIADGVVVGSALVDLIGQYPHPDELFSIVPARVRALRAAMDQHKET